MPSKKKLLICESYRREFDTMVDPDSREYLAEFADFVRLPSESIPFGLKFFREYAAEAIR